MTIAVEALEVTAAGATKTATAVVLAMKIVRIAPEEVMEVVEMIMAPEASTAMLPGAMIAMEVEMSTVAETTLPGRVRGVMGMRQRENPMEVENETIL